MKGMFFKGVVVGALTSTLVLAGSVAFAATGGNFIIGTPNTATSATSLSNTDTTAADSGLEVATASASAPAIRGRHTNATGTGPGLVGESSSTSPGAIGLLGLILPSSPGTVSAGVLGRNNGTGSAGFGVFGSHLGSGAGVMGQSVGGPAVIGLGQTGNGVLGRHTAASGVAAGVQGETSSTDPNATALLGKNLGGGPALTLLTAGAAPMTVNSTAKVVNLNADKLDTLDSLDFIRSNAVFGGDVSGPFSNLQIGANKIGTAEVAANSLTGADIDESTLGQVPSAANAATVDGQSAATFNYNVPGPSGGRTMFSLGGMTMSARCDGVSPGTDLLNFFASTDANDSYIRSDISGVPNNADWDIADGNPDGGADWFASTNDNAGVIVYRRGATGDSSAQVISITLAWNTTSTGCMLSGTVLGH